MYLLGDLLVRIKNANNASIENLSVPFSNLNKSVLQILQDQKVITDYKVIKQKNIKSIVVNLPKEGATYRGIKLVSKPGRRVYINLNTLQNTKKGVGFSVISTPKGVLTDKQALSQKVGGEVLFRVF